MKKVQTQLKTVAKTLAGLAEKLEKLNAMIGATPAKKKAAPAKKKAVAKKKAPAKKKAVATGKETVLDSVLEAIGKSKDGADIATLKSQTGLESRQLSNALYKLTKKGMIKSKSRGVYVKA